MTESGGGENNGDNNTSVLRTENGKEIVHRVLHVLTRAIPTAVSKSPYPHPTEWEAASATLNNVSEILDSALEWWNSCG